MERSRRDGEEGKGTERRRRFGRLGFRLGVAFTMVFFRLVLREFVVQQPAAKPFILGGSGKMEPMVWPRGGS
jgi:hypothetical protein